MVSRKKARKGSEKAKAASDVESQEREVTGVEEAGPQATATPNPDAVAVGEASALEEAVEAKAALENELEELKDRHLRLAAEFDNFRKRTVRERAQHAEQGQADLVKELLESLDDLARVSELSSSKHDAAAILEGVRLVERKLRRVLENLGLKSIEAIGQHFDPGIHEALVTVPVSDPSEDDLISQELVKGYTFKENLLRPSRVQVKKYQPDAAREGDGSGDPEISS